MNFETKRFQLTDGDVRRWAWKNARLDGQWITAACYVLMAANWFKLFIPDGLLAAFSAAGIMLLLGLTFPYGAVWRFRAALRLVHEVPGFSGTIKVEEGHCEVWRDGVKACALSFAGLDRVRRLADAVMLISFSSGTLVIPDSALPESVSVGDFLVYLKTIEARRPGFKLFGRSSS